MKQLLITIAALVLVGCENSINLSSINWPINITGIFLLIFGPLFSLNSFSDYKDSKKISDLMKTTKASLIDNLKEGPTEIFGVVSKCETPQISPWAKQECVHYNFTVERYRLGGEREEPGWVNYISEVKTNPFFIEDNTGRIAIDTSDIQFELKADKFSKSGHFMFNNEPDPHLKQLLYSRYGEKTRGLIFNKKLRYTETTLELGENVYVFGDAIKLGDNWVIRDGKMPLIISDQGAISTESNYTKKAIYNLIETLGWATAGLVGLLILIFY